MRILTEETQKLYLRLLERCLASGRDFRFDERGRFRLRWRKGNPYWHFLRPDSKGLHEEYVGSGASPALNALVERFNLSKKDVADRREMVRALVGAGMGKPARPLAIRLEALARVCESVRSVLVSDAVFPLYAGVLGVRLPRATMAKYAVLRERLVVVLTAESGDAGAQGPRGLGDVGQDELIGKPLVGEALSNSDAFRHIDPAGRDAFARVGSDEVEVIDIQVLSTKDHGRDEGVEQDSVPALSLAEAQFLIRNPKHAIFLAYAGLPFRIPAPSDFAVHHIVVAGADIERRAERLEMASQLVVACALAGRVAEVVDSWRAAASVSPSWASNLNVLGRQLSAEAVAVLVGERLL